jgi:putative ABC transport system permease protein
VHVLSGTWKDLAQAWRRHRRHPGLAWVIAATLALAVGLNASVFTIYTAVALRPWAVPAAERVVNIYAAPPDKPRGTTAIGASLAEVRVWNGNATLLAGVAATRELSLRLGDDRDGEPSPAQLVTGNFFDVLDVDMARGRGFLPEEDLSSSPQAVTVLSYLAWQRQFGGRDDIVGARIRLDDLPFTVVGVAPADFGGTSDRRATAWVPFAALRVLRPLDPSVTPLLESPTYCCSSVFGRLRDGVTRGQATAQLEGISADFARQHGNEVRGVSLTDTALLSHPGAWDRARLVFGLLQAAMVIVLLLACGNIGNLLLARAIERQLEMGTRLALGGTRARLIRQLLLESLIPASAGGALGLTLAHVLPQSLIAQMTDTPMNVRLEPGLAGALFTLVVTVTAVFAFGLAPALQATRADLTPGMRGRAWGSPLRLRSALLAMQVAACVVMLVSAALMLRGIEAVSRKAPGFRLEGIEVMQFDVPASAYGEAQSVALVQTLRAWQDAAGVPAVLVRAAPLGNARYMTSMRREDEPVDAERSTDVHKVDTSYFDVLGIPMVAGRAFTRADGEDVVIVNEAFARRWLGGRSALGATIVMGGTSARRVIGVARDAHLHKLDVVEPIAFEPLSTRDVPRLLLAATPGAVASATAAVKGLDPRIRVRTTSMAAVREAYLVSARLAGQLAATLGLVSLGLATIGLSGVCGYLVRQRTREFGLRIALGATPRHVLTAVFGTTARATLWGIGAGAVLAWLVAQVIVNEVPGVRLGDPVAYLWAIMALGVSGVAATYLPARRALGIDPAQALRSE